MRTKTDKQISQQQPRERKEMTLTKMLKRKEEAMRQADNEILSTLSDIDGDDEDVSPLPPPICVYLSFGALHNHQPIHPCLQ